MDRGSRKKGEDGEEVVGRKKNVERKSILHIMYVHGSTAEERNVPQERA